MDGRDGRAVVRYRIDDHEPEQLEFRLSASPGGLVLKGKRQSLPFIKSLFGADSLVVRIGMKNAAPIEAEFDISGLQEVIKPLRAECEW